METQMAIWGLRLKTRDKIVKLKQSHHSDRNFIHQHNQHTITHDKKKIINKYKELKIEKKIRKKEYINSRKHYSTYIFFLVIFNLKKQKNEEKENYDK